MGEAREPRGVGDAWLGSPRCGETAGPAEVGLGAFSDCQEPAVWLQRAPRDDSVPRASARRFSVLAALCSGRGSQVRPAMWKNGSLEVVAALKESCEQSPDSAPVLLPLAALVAEEWYS